MLSEHGAVVPIDEPLVGFYLGPFVSDYPGTDPRELDGSNFTWLRMGSGARDHFFAEAFADVWVPGLARMLLERFHAHVTRTGKAGSPLQQHVVIKEPNGSQSADVIMRALPRARLLFLLRDGRDVVDSDLAAYLPGAWISQEFPGLVGIGDDDRLAFVVNSAHKWLWRTEAVQEAMARHPGPAHLVRYEDLREEPLEAMQRIFDWLGIEATDADIQSWVERNSFERIPNRGPAEFARLAQPGAWRVNLRPDEQAAVEEVLGPKLRELGYER